MSHPASLQYNKKKPQRSCVHGPHLRSFCFAQRDSSESHLSQQMVAVSLHPQVFQPRLSVKYEYSYLPPATYCRGCVTRLTRLQIVIKNPETLKTKRHNLEGLRKQDYVPVSQCHSLDERQQPRSEYPKTHLSHQSTRQL